MGIDLRRKAMAREPDSPIENRSVYYFREFYSEMLTIFEHLRTIIKPSDDFDVDSFIEYLSKKRSAIPEAWAAVTNDDPNNFPWNVSDRSYMTGSNSEGWATSSRNELQLVQCHLATWHRMWC